MSASFLSTIHLGRDNTIDIALTQERTPITAAALTRIMLVLTDPDDASLTKLDSDVIGFGAGDNFDITQSQAVYDPVTKTNITVNIIKMKLGDQSIPVKNGYTADLIVYDASNANGILWETFTVNVEADVAA